MPFDFAWDFRSSVAYTTDPNYGVYGNDSTLETVPLYPHTFTNGNGLTINAGWNLIADLYGNDENSGNDARIAGSNSVWSTNHLTFLVALASGSGAGTGTYTVDVALGSAAGGRTHDMKLFDNTTLLIDLTNGGSGIATAAGHYLDATGADVAASTTWTGATVSKTFATTTCILDFGADALGVQGAISHFRLTLQAGGGTAYTLTADTGAFTLNLNPIQPVANVRTTTFALTGFPAALRWSAAGGGLTAYHHHYGG